MEVRDSSGSLITVEIDKWKQGRSGGQRASANCRYEVEVREQMPTAGMKWRSESKCQLQDEVEVREQVPTAGMKWRSESKCQLQV